MTGPDPSRDRGQVLLAGAVILALAILALVIVVNTAVVTDTATGGHVGDTAIVRELNYEVERNVAALTIRTSHSGNYTDAGAVRTDVAAAIDRYSDLLAASYVSGDGGVASVSLRSVPANGTQVRQRVDRRFESPGGARNWSVVDDPARLGWFVVNFNLTAVSPDRPLVIRASNGSTTARMTFVRNESVDALRVESTVDGVTKAVRCSPAGGRVALDIREGASLTGGCSFPGLGELDGPLTEVRIENGRAAYGKYQLVVANRSATTVPVCAGSYPCRGPVPWSVDVAVSYQSNSIDYRRNVTVQVYGVN